ncbi:BTAD domain-containing putative transcriptional regulator [Deinococcus rubellus]
MYLELEEPEAADHRWGGYCLFALGELLPAKDLLMQAKAEGSAAAGIELAVVLRYLGDLSAAHHELDAVMECGLPALEQAAALRERGALHLYEGRAALAQTVLEAAWRAVSSLGRAGQPFLAPTAQLLGYTYALLGREAPAIHYLNLALRAVVGVKRVHPLHSRAQIHLQMGHYVQATSDLQEASAYLPSLQSAAAHQAYLEGVLACAQGHWTLATPFLSRARGQAQTSGETGTEFLAELSLASVLTVQADYDAALAHLLRAQHLSGNVWEQALFELRSGSWAAAQGQAAQTQLEAARDAFTKLDLPREMAWAELHLAACALPSRPAEALAALRRAVNHRHRLGSGAPLLPELRLLPSLVQFMSTHPQESPIKTLLSDRREMGISEPLHIRLVTFGRAHLLADGQEVQLRLKRMLELLAFLLLRGPVSRDTIMLNLWPDDDPRKAVNYFHQANHLLKSAAPTLRLAFDKTAAMYTLRCEGPVLTSDIGDIKRLLSADDENLQVRALELYTGPFLPQVEAQWAREEGDTVEWSMINTALGLMARWSREGRYDKCRSLSQRLVEVFPCDESLVEYLVEATLHLDGSVAAQRTLLEASGRAELLLNQTPDWMARLNTRIHQLN